MDKEISASSFARPLFSRQRLSTDRHLFQDATCCKWPASRTSFWACIERRQVRLAL